VKFWASEAVEIWIQRQLKIEIGKNNCAFWISDKSLKLIILFNHPDKSDLKVNTTKTSD
jgi:hypothetical protein